MAGVKGEGDKKVYVGGIPYYVTEDGIRSYFEGCGSVESVELLTFPDSGRFRGIAFVTFKSMTATKKALALDGSDMDGRYLKIQPWRPNPNDQMLPKKMTMATIMKEEKEKAPSLPPPSKTEGCTKAFIGNLAWNVDEDAIKDFFHGCRIKSIKFVHDKETQKFKGCGHVEFEDDESLEVAMTLDQKHLLGRPMKVAYAVTGSFRKVQGGPVSEKRKVSGPVPTEAAAGSFGTITGRVSDSRSEGKKIRMESQNMREGIAAAAADADNATSLGGDPTTKVSEELQDLGNGSSISNTRKSKPRQGQIAAAAGRNESNGWEKHSNDEANEGADGLVHGDAIGAEGTGGDEEDGGKRRRRGGRGKKNVCCHSCGGTGHKSFDCPSGNSGGGEGEGG
eukprot:TRINITY_DN580_c0_g1_i1.p1 TRINITY_DN580_c0_g1~~TRINITY_DN580_c0_g1_i1.p1  ORF type:complete len:393 (+),score=115.65 TRINITY_DN580_c0_g1_i1:70-1248(+)